MSTFKKDSMLFQHKKQRLQFNCAIYVFLLLLLAANAGCKKYLEIPLPVNRIAGEAAFTNDISAAAVLNNVFNNLIASGNVVDGSSSAAYLYGLYGDELINNATSGTNNPAFYSNNIQSTNTAGLWTNLYKQLHPVNLAIEGIANNDALVYKNQWLGEAYFLRAFIHFYLANMYGNVPIVTSSVYTTNNTLKRSPQADVYAQIIRDLKTAQSLLSADYRNANGAITADRARPNKAAATALLARTYLYTGDWANAEAQVNTIIGDVTYQLVPLNQVFLVASKEAIWGMAPGATAYTVKEATNYLITAGTTPVQTQGASIAVSLSPIQVNAFEAGDARKTTWVGVSNVTASGSTPAATYYFANKYKTKPITPALTAPVEYNMVLRLGEQYLVRAEARAQLGKLVGVNSAQSDLDTLRKRAGLAGVTATSKTDMLTAVMHERQVELFVEGGHRFFDLRRTGTLDAVMNIVAPQKAASWATFKQWWPIRSEDIVANPNLEQTPGYQ
jgi:starch-binding outer membrane protein, SusD/RagB family